LAGALIGEAGATDEMNGHASAGDRRRACTGQRAGLLTSASAPWFDRLRAGSRGSGL